MRFHTAFLLSLYYADGKMYADWNSTMANHNHRVLHECSVLSCIKVACLHETTQTGHPQHTPTAFPLAKIMATPVIQTLHARTVRNLHMLPSLWVLRDCLRLRVACTSLSWRASRALYHRLITSKEPYIEGDQWECLVMYLGQLVTCTVAMTTNWSRAL